MADTWWVDSLPEPARTAPRERRTINILRRSKAALAIFTLLAGVSLGRVVFTEKAPPTIRPVNHVLVDGELIIRTHTGATWAGYVERTGQRGAVVAYEAEAIDPYTHLGWSVIVTGYAHLVTDQDQLARYQAIPAPWID